MGLLILLAEATTALNIVLLSALVGVWGRNYRQFRSKHTMGMLTFAVVLMAQNALSLYFYLWHPVMSAWFRDPVMVPTFALRSLLVLDVLEMLAVLFLVWVTVD